MVTIGEFSIPSDGGGSGAVIGLEVCVGALEGCKETDDTNESVRTTEDVPSTVVVEVIVLTAKTLLEETGLESSGAVEFLEKYCALTSETRRADKKPIPM